MYEKKNRIYLIEGTLDRSLGVVRFCSPFVDHTFRVSTVPNFDDVKRRLLSFCHVVLVDCLRVPLSRSCAVSFDTCMVWAKKKHNGMSPILGGTLRRCKATIFAKLSPLHSETTFHKAGLAKQNFLK